MRHYTFVIRLDGIFIRNIKEYAIDDESAFYMANRQIKNLYPERWQRLTVIDERIEIYEKIKKLHNESRERVIEGAIG